MATLIKDRRAIADPWRWLDAGAAAEVRDDAGDVIVPLAAWLAGRDALLARPGRVGVWLDAHDDPAAIAADLRRIPLLALGFPKFGDGRSYSSARLLRERYGFTGELRAFGEVGRDLLGFMAGCGFDAFALRDGENVDQALAAFADFSDAYQSSVARPQPLFRRRLAQGAKP